MATILDIIDFLAKVGGAVTALAAILAFIFKKWISAKIDSGFKKKIDEQLEGIKHTFAIQLEEKKSDLSKALEQTKTEQAKQLELFKTQLEEDTKRSSQINAKKIAALEAYDRNFHAALVDINAIIAMNKSKALPHDVRDAFRIRSIQLLQSAMDSLHSHNLYLPTDKKLRIAKLYKEAMGLLVGDGEDEVLAEKLTLECASIGVELETELLGSG